MRAGAVHRYDEGVLVTVTTSRNENTASQPLKVSKRSAMPPFMALDVMIEASEMQAAGHDVIHLEIGQPSTPAPRGVRMRAQAELDNISAHGYSLAFGEPELRTAISSHYDRWYGLTPPVSNIAVTVGSSTAFAIAFMAAFDEGDVIALPTPCYPAYRNLMLGMGLTPKFVAAGAEQGWKPDLKEMESWDRLPDGLMIASPSNPTGTVLSASELEEICQWCSQHGVRLISDEIYHGLVFDGRAETALTYTADAIIISSFSKYFSMTGWRIGWMILPDDLVEPAQRLAQNLFISAPTLNQRACIAAFDCDDELEHHKQRYASNRATLLAGLPQAMTERAAPCNGAFYLYADVSAFTDNAIEFASRLLAEEAVATTPGVDFDPLGGHHYLRLSFAGSDADMHEAVRRISRFISRLKHNAA